jgi:hypothetical protein
VVLQGERGAKLATWAKHIPQFASETPPLATCGPAS